MLGENQNTTQLQLKFDKAKDTSQSALSEFLYTI